MEEISEDQIYNLLKETNEIAFKIISVNKIDLSNLSNIKFKNCIFINHLIVTDADIKTNPDLKIKSISFEKCIFNSIVFLSCNFIFFEIIDVKITNDFSINKCKIDVFRFLDCENLDCKINIRKTSFFENFNFENNHFLEKGCFLVLKSEFFNHTVIQNNVFSVVHLAFVKFKEFIAFINNDFLNISTESTFFVCEFEEQTDFRQNKIRLLKYVDCKFFGKVSFNDIPYQFLTSISFEMCDFHKSIQFNKSSFHKFSLDNTNFLGIASFQETFFDLISIERTIFEKLVFFDSIKINLINECNVKTIRAIKQQLQKAENRIDFNRFKNYEMATYYRELNWKENFVDKSILFMTKISTDFGSNWIKAFWFTIFSGIGFYLLFYTIENHTHTIDILNWNNWKRVISGLFRFFLVTDFYNPLETDRVYLTNPLSWLVFIFGKIVIAFGIYEMIQSFRKFKA